MRSADSPLQSLALQCSAVDPGVVSLLSFLLLLPAGEHYVTTTSTVDCYGFGFY